MTPEYLLALADHFDKHPVLGSKAKSVTAAVLRGAADRARRGEDIPRVEDYAAEKAVG